MKPFATLRQPVSRVSQQLARSKATRYAVAGVVAAGALAIAALVNRRFANKAERENTPTGHFLEIGGVRIHYVERGEGEPLVLLHGNGSIRG